MKIKELHCGFKHVAIRSQMGMIFSWGDNSLYQLGQQTNHMSVNVPKKIAFSRISKFRISIKSIALGGFSSYFLDKHNNVYFCGDTGLGLFYNIQHFPY